MAKIGKIQEVAIADLRPYERNAKLHSEDQVDKIAASIEEFGFLNPVLIDKDKNVIAGHGRIMAAQKLGRDKVPCLPIEGLTDTQRRAYILADNKLTEMGEWNTELVSQELEDLKELGFDIDVTGFDIDDIVISEDMVPDYDTEEPTEQTETEPRIKRGELWQLGNHRLMCGDSTKPEDVMVLVGGEQMDLLLTDPPYNVDIGGKNEVMAKAGYLNKAMGIENDAMDDDSFYDFLEAAFSNAYGAMKPGASFYIWYASIKGDIFYAALKKNGLKISEQLIWVKNTMAFGMSDYQWRHEPCIYGWKEGAAHHFIDVRSLTTVFDRPLEELSREEAINALTALCEATTTQYENKPQRSEDHPTMKPINLFKKLIRNSSREGDAVLDLFGGSGTTLLACEDMERKCYMMEYDPKYAEVIIRRWEEKTGRKGVKIDG